MIQFATQPDDAFISVFTPSQTKNEILEAIFVQRHALLEDAVERMDESASTGNKHHLLYVGPRGSGKTYFVTLLVHRLEQRPDISRNLHIAWLNEDETSTTVLDLLLRIHRALVKRHPGTYKSAAIEPAYGLGADKAQAFIINILLESIRRENKTLLVIVENLDALFEGLGDIGQKKLRALIQENPHFAIVATAQTLSDYLKKRTHPFFGFFQTTHLKPLTEKEAGELLVKISRLNHREGVAEFLKTRKGRARIRALHHLSGGNHRMYIVLSQFITRDSIDALVGPFVKMVDELTPYYQERLRWLPAQQRKIVEFLSTSSGTVSVKEIAKRLFATPQTISSQLKDLREKGYVTSTPRGREALYEITEPLMRICVEVKENQSHEPLALLVDFIRAWYDQSDLSKRLEDENLSAVARPYLVAAMEKNLAQEFRTIPVTEKGPDPFSQAASFLTSNELEEAITTYTRLIETDKTPIEEIARALFNRGIAYGRNGEIEKEIADYTALINFENVSTDYVVRALTNRGATYGQKGELKKAITDFSTILDFEEVFVEGLALALLNRGVTYGQKGEIEREIADYTALINFENAPIGRVAQALVNRGITYEQKGNVEEAIADFNAVINLKDTPFQEIARALVGRGRIYGQNGDTEKEVADYTYVIDVAEIPDKQVVLALINRGIAYWHSGQAEKAITDFTAIMDLEDVPIEQAIDAHIYSAEIRVSEGRWSEGISLVQEALKLTTPPYIHASSRLVSLIFSESIKPALRKRHVVELTRLYAEYESAATILGAGLLRHLGSLHKAAQLPSPENLDSWLSAWEEASEGVDELRIPMRIFRTGIAFLKTGGQDLGILADLAENERSILKQAFGIDDWKTNP